MKMIDMFYALTDFCVCQDGGRYSDEDVIAEMVGGLLEHYDKRCRHLESAIEPKRRYRIISGGKDKNLLPTCVMENDILCGNGITLCYINSAKGSEIAGYEVVYDCDCDVVRLFYKVTLRCGNAVTVYRTEADTIENFVFFNFFIELSSQLNSMIDEVFTRNFLKAIFK